MEGPQAGPARPSACVFLANLPYTIDEEQLHRVLSGFGKVEKLRLQQDPQTGKNTGKGWALFDSFEASQRAVDANEQLESNGRRIRIALHHGPMPGEEGHRQGGRPGPPGVGMQYGPGGLGQGQRPAGPRRVQVDVQPHAECWFCLANPKVEKHLITAVGKSVYVALAKGPLVPEHCLIVPINHHPNLLMCPDDVLQEMEAFLEALKAFFSSMSCDMAVFERYVPMSNTKAMHMQLQAVPVPRAQSFQATEIFMDLGKKAGLNLEHLPREGGIKTLLNRAGSNAGATTAYIYLQLPGDNSAKGKLTEHFCHFSQRGGARMPMNFCRDVLAELLEERERADWKAAALPPDEEAKLAANFRQRFAKFAPK